MKNDEQTPNGCEAFGEDSVDTVDLATFIRENESLLNSVAIFTAAIVAAAELLPSKLGFAVSFVVLILVFLMIMELTSRFPDDAFRYPAMSDRAIPYAHWRLAVFANIALLLTLILPIYHFLAFYEYWRDTVPIILSIYAASAVFVKLGRIFPILKVRHYQEIGIPRAIFLGMLFLGLMVSFVTIGPALFKLHVDPLIQNLRLELQSSVE
jgi:hypothetical protein